MSQKSNICYYRALSIVCIFVLFISACLVSAESTNEKKEITVTDMLGRTVTLKTPVERVVLASGRDIHEIAALKGKDFLKSIVGLGSDLQSMDLDTYNKIKESYPEIEKIPDIGYFNTGTLSAEKVVSLNPDVILVPVWGKDKISTDVEKFEAAGIPVVYTDFWAKPLENPSTSMKLLGKIYGEEDRANEIAKFFDDKITTIEKTISDKKGTKPSVYVECAWKSIKDYGNSYSNSAGWGAMVTAAGGENIANSVVNGTTGTISPEYLISKNPDKIIFSGSYWKDAPESLRLGYSAKPSESKETLTGLTTREGWQNLDAVKNKEVYGLFHGMSFHIYNYIGLEALAKWLYPDLFGEFDPESDFKEFHTKYMPYDLSGTWFVSLKE